MGKKEFVGSTLGGGPAFMCLVPPSITFSLCCPHNAETRGLSYCALSIHTPTSPNRGSGALFCMSVCISFGKFLAASANPATLNSSGFGPHSQQKQRGRGTSDSP
jgi:hypothetical protein